MNFKATDENRKNLRNLTEEQKNQIYVEWKTKSAKELSEKYGLHYAQISSIVTPYCRDKREKEKEEEISKCSHLNRTFETNYYLKIRYELCEDCSYEFSQKPIPDGNMKERAKVDELINNLFDLKWHDSLFGSDIVEDIKLIVLKYGGSYKE